MSSNRLLCSSPMHFIQQLAVLLASITVIFGLAACEHGEVDEQAEASYELASRIAQNEGEICEPFDFSPEADSTSNDEDKRGEATKCGARSSTVTFYEPPSQPIDTGEANWSKAKAKCAKWGMEYSKPMPEWSAPKCPVCPDGSSGCKVTGIESGRENMEWNGSTYSCTGGDFADLKLRYSCTKCLLDGCGDDKKGSGPEEV
jgi:hypothetical protein